MNLPGYDAWKLACPYDMTESEDAALIQEHEDARQNFRDALEALLHDERGELYLSEVHDIVGEVLAKQKRQPGEPEHQVKMLNPIKAAPLMLAALKELVEFCDEANDYEATHPQRYAAYQNARAVIAAATGAAP